MEEETLNKPQLSAEERHQKSINRFFGLFLVLDILLLIFIIVEIIIIAK